MQKRRYFSPVESRRARFAVIGALAGLGLIAGAGEKITGLINPVRVREYKVDDFDAATHEEEMGHAYDFEDTRTSEKEVSRERLESEVWKVSPEGLELVKKFEGFGPEPYPCPAGKWTIGYGHVITKGEKFGRISREEANALLRKDMKPFEETIRRYVDVELGRKQFDALSSFAYNIGPTAFRESTLLRKLNARDYSGAADEFPRWNKSEGIVLPGLVHRRYEEMGLFRSESSEEGH